MVELDAFEIVEFHFIPFLRRLRQCRVTSIAMDTSGFSQVGRYGTLSLLKKHNAGVGNAEASQVVTSFGIDNSNLTFGRASTCDVRLYYPSVDPVHCTLVNEEGKVWPKNHIFHSLALTAAARLFWLFVANRVPL